MTGPSAKKEMAERRAIIRSEKLRPGDQPATTFHALANLDTSLEGRFAAGGYVSGSEPSVNYPAGPAWTRTGVPDEEPLGIAIDAMEPTGNFHEIEASLSNAAPAVSSAGSQPGEGPTAPSLAERIGAVPSLSSSGGGTAPTPHERLATILPKIAVAIPASPKRRKV